MADYLRLRQICLATRELEPVVDDIRAILGVEICYRDSGVAKYGLVNALLPIGTSFLEVVAPVEPNTAAGRFLDRSGGHGGYMAIFDGGDDLSGAYHPAGPDWRAAIRTDQTKALVETEIETPEPEALARHWGSILE